MTGVAGVLLAAGAGRRFGGPKALALTDDGTPQVRAAAETLLQGGCGPVFVVVGAQAPHVATLLPPGAQAVWCLQWEAGLAQSVRAGLAAVATLNPRPTAALLHLVDLPDIGPNVIARLHHAAAADVVARAAYADGPGHPVLLGMDHWPAAMRTLTGDTGLRTYLDTHPNLRLVQCADLATGRDRDVR